MPRVSKPKVKTAEPLCTITVTINNETFTGQGSSILEALQSIPRPTKIMAKGVIRVRVADKTRTVFFPTVKMKRFFYPIAQPYQAKMLAFGLK